MSLQRPPPPTTGVWKAPAMADEVGRVALAGKNKDLLEKTFHAIYRAFNAAVVTTFDVLKPTEKMQKMGIGMTPKEYNPKVHGPYYPWVYYGKKDIPLSEVKVGELPGWLARRDKSPRAMARAISRGYWRWGKNYMWVKNRGLVGPAQLVFMICAYSYFINYPKIADHKNYKHHW